MLSIQSQIIFFSYWVVVAYFLYNLKCFFKNKYLYTGLILLLSFGAYELSKALEIFFYLERVLVKFYEFPKIKYFFNYHLLFFNFLTHLFFNNKNIFLTSTYFFCLYFSFFSSKKFIFYTQKNKKYFPIYSNILEVAFVFSSLGTYLLFLLGHFVYHYEKMGTKRILVEGNEVIRNTFFSQIRLKMEMSIRSGDGFYFFKNLRLPKNLEVLNTLIVGAMGSGKTSLLAPIFMQFFHRKNRSLVIDNKLDYCELVGEKEGVIILSPFDARSPVWNIAEDIVTELEAMEFVSVCIPCGHGSNNFFALAARDVALGAIKFLQTTNPYEWNLGDIFSVIGSDNLLSLLKDHHPGALQILRDCGIDHATGKMFVGETGASIFAQIRANLQNFEILAKAWPTTNGGFSVRKWARGEDEKTISVIVPFMQIYPEVSGFFSSLVVDIFINETLNLPDSKERRVGLFLDELGAMPRIKSLSNATKMFRSKGGCLFVGIQEVGVIRSKYQEDGGTESILNGFSMKLIGRAETSEYADYFVKAVGKNKYQKITRSRSIDTQGRHSTSTSEEVVVEDAINTGELLSIPPASLKSGAYFYLKMSEIPVIFKLKWPIVPFTKPFQGNVEPAWLKRPQKPPQKEKKEEPLEQESKRAGGEATLANLSILNESSLVENELDSMSIFEKNKNNLEKEDVDLTELSF